ncbi:PREDICTED: Hermansky-Pudlak syndrome 1 protein homolog isoform X2 [Ceratosolen solmsi marchali]|uniref:Hermansky-Pudlak syndrome 1 protein homolog isoform X2 n=1 Tax=Ceratosolen solmsi marchali TaxID=326594 RepID=A0AAJ6YXY8_9HYME|nr:PREDICTED: Hermansky-Pudlak syndrome 1 protein homolog isoform X2 [Ceratosolen solmsi marchali]
MRGILIFDQLNDVLFTKCNKKFANHIQKLAKLQGLVTESKNESNSSRSNFKPSPNIIMQLFSPIVTSQHIMASQFGNTYTSMKCQDGTNMVFNEFMGYMFIYISNEELEIMRRTIGVCITVVRYLCGPDVSLLKISKQRVQMVSFLLDAWSDLRGSEQNILTEAVEQLSVNADLASATLRILSDAADKLKAQSEFSNVHVLILVEHKFLSLFSSKNAQDLLASDILMMVLLCYVANKNKTGEYSARENDSNSDSILLFQNGSSNKMEIKPRGHFGKLSNPTSEDINHLFEGSRDSSISEGLCLYALDGFYSQLMFLGSEETGYTANTIHISELSEGINLVTIVEMTNLTISSGLYDSFRYLNIINGLQLQRDIDELRPAFDNLEVAIKKTLDGIKKNRANVSNEVDMYQRRMQVKWEFVKKKYTELLKSRDVESILQVESNTSSFLDALKELFRMTCLNKNFLKHGKDVIMTVSRLVCHKLNDFNDFLKVKALKNFTIGSSLTINKYLEEFPGLVHFIYIDRTTHRLIAPTIDFTNCETLALTTRKIWNMVEQSRIHLQEGHMSIMWKDTTFNYAYFLWFEDSSGSPLKCKTYFNHMLRNFPVPGIFCGDYYRKLADTYFPKLSASKIRIYELYCVHLGLATSSCVLEHSRRLAATIWEVTGLPNNPADLI